jgi:hypothetical protein
MRNVLFYLNNRIILFFIALLFFATLTHATIPRLQNKQLDYELTPYLWATGQTGTIQWLRGPGNGIAINQSFSDILKRLDRAGMVYFEVKNEQGGLLIDGIYLRISDNHALSNPYTAIHLQGAAQVTQQLYSLAGFFRSKLAPKTTLDAMLGVRYNRINTDINIQLISVHTPEIARHFAGGKCWFDPYIGLRVFQQLTYKWNIFGYIDVGGTNFSHNSTYQVLGGINYIFNSHITGRLSYRYLYNHYKKSDFYYHIYTSGPYLGLAIVW